MLKRIRELIENKKPHRSLPAEAMMHSLQELFEPLARDFNCTVAEEPLKITVRQLAVEERNAPACLARLLVHTGLWALSIRAFENTIECFILPTTELENFLESETPSRLKLKLSLGAKGSDAWLMDGLPVSSEELETLMRSLLKDLVSRSQGDYELMPESMRLVYGGVSLTRSVRSLVADKHMLMQKVVNQQEQVLSAVARDLHDAVLGNVLLLKRDFCGPRNLTDEEVARLIEEISSRLREICHDLYPRDLKDCGLRTLLEQMCYDFKRRSDCSVEFKCDCEIPDIADEVVLHIYRIAQECFNNVAKHSGARSACLEITVNNGRFTMTIEDDGKGFIESATAQSNDDSGGTGLGILKERTELIDCLYPSRISLESKPAHGTRITLEIMIAVSGEDC